VVTTRLDIDRARADLSKIADTVSMMREENLDSTKVELLFERKKFELQNLLAWRGGVFGPHCIAVRAKVYDARKDEIDSFLGEPIWKDTHRFGFEGESYEVFSLVKKEDADRFMETFGGEPFDYRDTGSGKNWSKWYKGSAARREANRSPYDFRK
jgi:hypothetical protein